MRYIFGDYALDTQRLELHHVGEPIKLRRKVFQVLVYLLAHRDRVVPKQELLDCLWPDQFVGDETLTSCIKTLRKALAERGRATRGSRRGAGPRFQPQIRPPWGTRYQPPFQAERAQRPAERRLASQAFDLG